jgi:hypothetical protein
VGFSAISHSLYAGNCLIREWDTLGRAYWYWRGCGRSTTYQKVDAAGIFGRSTRPLFVVSEFYYGMAIKLNSLKDARNASRGKWSLFADMAPVVHLSLATALALFILFIPDFATCCKTWRSRNLRYASLYGLAFLFIIACLVLHLYFKVTADLFFTLIILCILIIEPAFPPRLPATCRHTFVMTLTVELGIESSFLDSTRRVEFRPEGALR